MKLEDFVSLPWLGIAIGIIIGVAAAILLLGLTEPRPRPLVEPIPVSA